jgi:hypothetical protein
VIVRQAVKPSKYIAFLDECGDHTLDGIDKDFPLFLLSTVVVRREDYVKRIVPAVAEFKLRYWDHEGINLHSRDIRKAAGGFSFLQVREIRTAFLSDLSGLMEELPFTVFISAVRKDRHKELKGHEANNPYELALESTLDMLVSYLAGKNETVLPFVAEARGKNEDQALQAVFYRLMQQGTSTHSADLLRTLNCDLIFRRKYDNIAGIQLADLCAHPCARHILHPDRHNQAFGVVTGKIHRDQASTGWVISP